MAWLLIHVSGCLLTMMFWKYKLLDSGTRTVATVSIFGSDFVYIGTHILFNGRIIFYHDEIELLVRRNGRGVLQLISQVTFWAPTGLICLRRALYGSEKLLGQKEVYFSWLHFCLMLFFSVSIDVVSNLRDAAQDLVALTANIEANLREIRFLKWELTDRIRKINGSFSWLWGVHCLLTFETAVFIVVEMVGGHLTALDKIAYSMAEIFALLRLYQVADGSSTLRALSLELEGIISRGRSKNEIRKSTAESLLPSMAYREDWDILRSGCFPLETGRFLGFLTTSVTCTAVVLQFDYHILQNIAQMTMHLTRK